MTANESTDTRNTVLPATTSNALPGGAGPGAIHKEGLPFVRSHPVYAAQGQFMWQLSCSLRRLRQKRVELREEFLIDRHGKTHVLYAGLLDAAHERGLSSIDTEIIQAPTAENGHVAIVRATVEMANVDDEAVTHRHFSGIGDASPGNVSKQMVPHILRMAETRAKARALRDAINVGVTALEELSGEDSGEVSDERTGEVSANTIGDTGATQLYKHMLAHGWTSADVGDYEESHKPLADHTDEEGRKLWKAVKAQVT